jgi:hypothetical protein
VPVAVRSASSAARWTSAALDGFMFLCAIACVYSMRRIDPDLFGYLSSGRLFVDHGITTHDPFAYTSAGYTWITFEYGAHIALWLAYRLAGPIGLIALKCLVGGGALWLMAMAIRAATGDTQIRVPVFLLCASALSRFFLFRPQLFTFACFALFVAVLFKYLVQPSARARPWVLPVVMLLWANAHGGFVAGLGAIALAIGLKMAMNVLEPARAGDRVTAGTGPLWISLGLCVAVTFVNPMGPRLWTYVLTELLHGTNRRYTVEWGPASLATDAWSALALALIAATVSVVAWSAWRARRRAIDIAWALTCVPLLAMAAFSVRHVPIAAVWSAPVIARLAARAMEPAAFRRVWVVLSGVAVVPACLTVALVLANPQPVISAEGHALGSRNPCRAVAFLKANHLRGNVFTPLWWGSYASWELYPSMRVSMDGRNISLYPDRMVVENFEFYLNAADAADLDAPLRYATDFLLVPSDSAVLRRLESDRRWQPVFADGEASVFERSDRRASEAFAQPPAACSISLPESVSP